MKRTLCILLCAALFAAMSAGCGKPEKAMPAQEAAAESGYRRTILYYGTADGYVVPVMKRIPWEEGIGKAALRYLTSSEDNDRSAELMGLETVIPEGTGFTLRIRDDGTANIDMLGLSGDMGSDKERVMVTAIVNTLCEFSSIDRVGFTVEGKKQDTLPCGTDISGPMEPVALNVEEGAVQVSGRADPLTLYFPNLSASLNIPVTRYVDAAPSFSLAVRELVAGSGDKRLLDCFPDGTELLSAYVDDGVARVDFTKEFKEVESVDGMLEAARDTIYLCANEFEPVYGVDIYVDGREYSPHTSVSAPVYANEFR